MTDQYQGSIFWIEVGKINPNPYQPRQEFNEDRLRDLADSIRQYGVLQPIVVSRQEVEKEDGGLNVEYELITGERRLRAARIAGLSVVPAVIRSGEDTDKMKLEMAIIENLQREDLNPVDRAQAFFKLANEFSLKHIEIAKRIGKSREYVSNSIRILALPQEILDALVGRQITEGHTRPILMLTDRPEEQMTLFQEIVAKRLNVRDAENIARRIAYERVRRKADFVKPEIIALEEKLSEVYGTRVRVEQKEGGGRVLIDFFSEDDLLKILALMNARRNDDLAVTANSQPEEPLADAMAEADRPADARSNEEVSSDEQGGDDDLYFIKNFTI